MDWMACPAVPRTRLSSATTTRIFPLFVDGELDLRDVRSGGGRGLRPLAFGQDADEGFVGVGLGEGRGELLLSAAASRRPSAVRGAASLRRR